MSRKDSTKPESYDPHPVRSETEEQRAKRKKREKILWVVVFVFCLVTFSITTDMTLTFRRWFSGGPSEVATLVLPKSGPGKISIEEYRVAFDFAGRDASTEDVIALATLRRLADDYHVVVTDSELQQRISIMMLLNRIDTYEQLWRGSGYDRAVDYEAWLRESMRADSMARLLQCGTVSTTPEAVAAWAKSREEMRLEFATWEGKEFTEAARQETPTDEQLETFYKDGLSFQQRSQLEREAAIQFDALLLSSDALATEAVKAWAGSEAPTEQQLADFYERQKYTLYSRALPPDGQPTPEDWTPVLSRAEVDERLAGDYRLYSAAAQLQAEAATAPDLAAFAAAKGVEFVPAGDFTPLSQLKDLPRLGSQSLTSLSYLDPGQWGRTPIVVGDLAYLARLAQRREREMPELAEVHDSVVDYWREQRADELAKAAAEAFVQGLPRAQGAESGPVVVDEAAFSSAVAASNRPVQVLDWVARRPRPAADPQWGNDERLRPYLRAEIGAKLDDYEDGRVVGDLHLPDPSTYIVARVAARRPIDATHLWPAELAQARQEAASAANTRFQQDGLSYAGLSRAFLIEKVLGEAPQE